MILVNVFCLLTLGIYNVKSDMLRARVAYRRRSIYRVIVFSLPRFVSLRAIPKRAICGVSTKLPALDVSYPQGGWVRRLGAGMHFLRGSRQWRGKEERTALSFLNVVPALSAAADNSPFYGRARA